MNEHILGDPWPSAGVCLEMLEEVIELIRLLHLGEEVSFHGHHYEVQDARIYTLPDEPVPIYVSGFGPPATELAGRIGDGFCTASPDPDLVRSYRGFSGGGRPVQGGMKVCWADSEQAGLDTAHRLWANELLPGRLAQSLPRPQDFEAAASLVTREAVGQEITCGPDPECHLSVVQQYVDAGSSRSAGTTRSSSVCGATTSCPSSGGGPGCGACRGVGRSNALDPQAEHSPNRVSTSWR
ncbi:MAG: TIGR03557 family F420-dependent LLM class oxidoreductase [Pseudonocardia sp.]